MLAGHLTPETFSEDLVCRAFISSYLGDKKLVGLGTYYCQDAGSWYAVGREET